MAEEDFGALKTISVGSYDCVQCNQEEKNESKHTKLNIRVQLKSKNAFIPFLNDGQFWAIFLWTEYNQIYIKLFDLRLALLWLTSLQHGASIFLRKKGKTNERKIGNENILLTYGC